MTTAPLELVFLTHGLDQPGGGQAFNAGLIKALRAHHTVHVRHDADGLPPHATPVVDGLLLPDLEPHLATLVAQDAVAVIHHVSARAGRDPAVRETVQAIERRMLRAFRRIVATSAAVAGRLDADFALTATVLTPGQPDLSRTIGSTEGPCRILCAGVLTPRKGQDRLLHALARLTDLDWTLVIAGDARRDPVHAAAVTALVDTLQLQSRVTILPDPSPAALEQAWQHADLFALATSWEGHPAGVAEALRRGIPVLTTKVGDMPGLVPQSAGIICPPDDPATLSKCLRRAVFDRSLRASLADGAWVAGQSMPVWPQQALAFEAILRS